MLVRLGLPLFERRGPGQPLLRHAPNDALSNSHCLEEFLACIGVGDAASASLCRAGVGRPHRGAARAFSAMDG